MSAATDPLGVDILAENQRLKDIIAQQQRQIDAMVVGATMAQSPVQARESSLFSSAKATTHSRPKPADRSADAQLLMLLELAMRYRLCTLSQKEMMLSFVKSGRFDTQYYIDMWTRRLTDLSPQAAASVRKLLSSNAPPRSSSVPPRQCDHTEADAADVGSRKSLAATPVSSRRAAAETTPDASGHCRQPVIHRAYGARRPGDLTHATSPSMAPQCTSLAVAANVDVPMVAPQTKMVSPCQTNLAQQEFHQDADITRPDHDQMAQQAGFQDAAKNDSFQQAAQEACLTEAETVKQELEHDDGNPQREEGWHDAPQELLRRATRTFLAEDGAPQDFSADGQWRSAGPEVVQLALQSNSSEQSGKFQLRRELYDGLRSYQRAGVAWMGQLYDSKKGGILADEMGLGKTVQVCALLSGIRKAGATHALIIVPVSLLDQWDREASRWCPEWRVYTYHGSPAQRARALQAVMTPAGGVLLTSYAVLKNADDRLLQVAIVEADVFPGRRGLQAKRPRVEGQEGGEAAAGREAAVASTQEVRRPWDIVICDEAHVMRTISSLLGKHMRSVVSRSRILLTGTPVQNALQDLWSLMDFAQPGLLGNHATFVKNVSDPIDKGSVRGANPFAVQLKKHLCEQLWDLVKPHMLRRTKESVGLIGVREPIAPAICEFGKSGEAPLPPKLETVVWLMPSDEQVKAYKKLLEKSDVIQEANSNGKLGIAVFRAIGLLKRLSNHPALGLSFSEPDSWQDFLSEAFPKKLPSKRKAGAIDAIDAADDVRAAPEDPAAAQHETADVRAGRAVEMMLRKLSRDADSLVAQSAKLRCLTQLLPVLGDRGHRTLIFSQGIKMMDLVEHCVLKRLGITYLRVDGSTDVQSRADRFQQFQTQPSSFQCMLLTTGVGGYGLNLSGADRVVLLDPAWNPAVDAQAVERVHRIGQTREVKVYRLVMSGLIEDKMFRLQVFKMGLTKTALDAKQQQRYFTSAEIRGLFEWSDPSQGETRNLLLQKYGEEHDKAVLSNAQQDGVHDVLFKSGSVVGLSNYSTLYSSLAHEDAEPDEDCEAQVAAMKAKLGCADGDLERTADERRAVEEQLQAAQAGVQDSAKKILLASAARSKAAELCKQYQSELSKARRSETAARQRLEKAMKARVSAREMKLNADQAHIQAEQAAATARLTVTENLACWRAAVCSLERAFEETFASMSSIGPDGKTADRSMEVPLSKAKAVQKAFERAQKAWTIARAAWSASEETDGAALQAIGSKDRAKAEALQEKATARAEGARDATSSAIAGLLEAGVAFAESVQLASDQHVSVANLKATQQALKCKFRELSSSWTRTKQLQEAWTKASALHRRLAQKVFLAAAACADAEEWVTSAEDEHDEASLAEEAERSARQVCEQALLEAEGQRSAAEAEDLGQKRRRSECKAAITSAKVSLKPAKAAEKHASAKRAALLSHYSKADKCQIEQEINASEKSASEALSAVKALRAEEYDANQVEEAYQAKKKQRVDGNADNID